MVFYHAVNFVSIKNQVDINATETSKANIDFYRKSQSQRVVIKGYHNDHGVFNVSRFM